MILKKHFRTDYGGFKMPRQVTFFDGVQSPTTPQLGSLNRLVTATKAAPLDIIAGVGIPINDKPVEMIFIQSSTAGEVNISATHKYHRAQTSDKN